MQKYYLVQPLAHGNGGWYGYRTMKEYDTLDEALKYRPTEDDLCSFVGWNSLRICVDENANNAVYIWDYNDHQWELV